MKTLFLAAILVFLFGAAAPGEAAETAHATLHNAKGEVVAEATLTEHPEGGVKIALKAWDLPPGAHGFHIHAVGKCEPPDFTSAGGHFNPFGKEHGLRNPAGAHAGDLDNLFVEEDGTAEGEWLAKDATLGEGENSLFHPDGTAFIVHAAQDDEVSDPTGNAGARIACGVITEEHAGHMH